LTTLPPIYGIVCFTSISVSSILGRRAYSITSTTCTYKTAHTDACKTHCTIPVRTTVFLKINPRFRNM